MNGAPPLDASTLATWLTHVDGDPSATIRPDREQLPQSDVVDALLAHPDGRDELAFGEPIGSGGMGVVRAAEQTRLGRTVAVKSLRPGLGDPTSTRRLLDEAWVTGALEHPNIVPVYDIAVDADHRPHIVMKRIAGVLWAAVIDDADQVERRFGTRDLLVWNLGILTTVCNALHFAHTRGVVHRDVKPENVMIGAFGEVYVVDWGIAVSLGAPDPRLPGVSPGRIAGTPRYMAPEMVRGGSPGVTTDVYLLGGVLYRVLCGEPPHRGLTVRDILAAVGSFEPRFPADCPTELQTLVRDAMHADPDARVPSADVFRQRVETFLGHRGSAELVRQADGHLRALREALDVPSDRVRVHGLLGACRFGFQEALRAWPENPDARDGLSTAIEAVARFELGERDPRAAGLLLAELPDPDPALIAEVERLMADRERDLHALARLQQDLDPRIGQRTRVFMTALFGLMWVVFPIAAWAYYDRPYDILGLLIFSIGMTVVVAAFLVWGRESMRATPINRAAAVLILLTPGSQTLLHTALWLHGADGNLGLTTQAMVHTLLSALGGFFVDRALYLVALGYLGVTLLSAVDPANALPWSSAGNAWFTVVLLAAWLPGMPAEPTHRTLPRDGSEDR